MASHQLQLAEQQIAGYHAAKWGDTWADLVTAMALTEGEYEVMIKEGMLDYLSDDEKDEIRLAVKYS